MLIYGVGCVPRCMLFYAPAYVICPASPRHVPQISTFTDLIVKPSFLCQKSISARLLPLATRRVPAPCRSSARFATKARCSSSLQQHPLHTRLSTTSEGPGLLSSRSHLLKSPAGRLNSVASTSALAGHFVVNSCSPLLTLEPKQLDASCIYLHATARRCVRDGRRNLRLRPD